jgi:hypothetical protein
VVANQHRAEQPAQQRLAQGELQELLALVRAEMEKGTDPADAKVQVLAKRWRALVNELSRRCPEGILSCRHATNAEPHLLEEGHQVVEIREFGGSLPRSDWSVR